MGYESGLNLAAILAKYTGTPNGTKFLRDDGSWQNATTTDASALTSGTLPLARLSGITTTELSASAGIVSGQIAGVALDKLTSGTLATTLALGTQGITNTGNASWYFPTAKYLWVGISTYPSLVIGFANNGQGDDRWGIGQFGLIFDYNKAGIGYAGTHIYHSVPTGMNHVWTIGGSTAYKLHLGFANGAGGDDRFYLGGFGTSYSSTKSGIASTGTTSLDMGVASGGIMKKYFAGVEKYRFSAALCEFDRISLGGTLGSSVDPGAGGIALVGRVQFTGAGLIKATGTTQDIVAGSSSFRVLNNGQTNPVLQWAESGATLSLYGGATYRNWAAGSATYTDIWAGTTGLRMVNNAASQVFFSWDDAGTMLTLGWGAWSGCKVLNKFGLGVTPVAQQTGGVLTAAGTYGANEQSMIQKAYDCLRSFGFLS